MVDYHGFIKDETGGVLAGHVLFEYRGFPANTLKSNTARQVEVRYGGGGEDAKRLGRDGTNVKPQDLTLTAADETLEERLQQESYILT